MKITDMITITELSRMLGKSRPTVYKYIADFESGNHAALPSSVKKLFVEIAEGKLPKREIAEYCDYWFDGETQPPKKKKAKEKPLTLKDIFALLKRNESKLDLAKLKNYIEEEIAE